MLAYSTWSRADLSVGASSDGAKTFSTPNPIGSDIPLVARQWLASDGTTVSMSYHIVLRHPIVVARPTTRGRH